ncbi:hypothetical protein BJ741DRAFT_704792 [Chytriomyces cf. hyalinus JEL632]|nr:hypothetical protein BJ741DRAFT_704792 [Chytriomyces cf. hyalinus JEL632]
MLTASNEGAEEAATRDVLGMLNRIAALVANADTSKPHSRTHGSNSATNPLFAALRAVEAILDAFSAPSKMSGHESSCAHKYQSMNQTQRESYGKRISALVIRLFASVPVARWPSRLESLRLLASSNPSICIFDLPIEPEYAPISVEVELDSFEFDAVQSAIHSRLFYQSAGTFNAHSASHDAENNIEQEEENIENYGEPTRTHQTHENVLTGLQKELSSISPIRNASRLNHDRFMPATANSSTSYSKLPEMSSSDPIFPNAANHTIKSRYLIPPVFLSMSPSEKMLDQIPTPPGSSTLFATERREMKDNQTTLANDLGPSIDGVHEYAHLLDHPDRETESVGLFLDGPTLASHPYQHHHLGFSSDHANKSLQTHYNESQCEDLNSLLSQKESDDASRLQHERFQKQQKVRAEIYRMEDLQRAFDGWLKVTQNSRHERDRAIENWVKALQAWRKTNLIRHFNKWTAKTESNQLVRKRNGFTAFRNNALLPKQSAHAFFETHTLRNNFVKWFRAAYKKRSFKRKMELALDAALAFNVQRTMISSFKIWTQRLVRNAHVKTAERKTLVSSQIHLKRNSFKFWVQMHRNLKISTVTYEKQSLKTAFRTWKTRMRISCLEKNGDIHLKYRQNELVLFCLQLWREKRIIHARQKYRIKEYAFSSWQVWFDANQSMQHTGHSFLILHGTALLGRYFLKWHVAFQRHLSFKAKVESIHIIRRKKYFLQWIRHMRYTRCVSRMKSIVSSRVFIVSKLLFFEAGPQIKNIKELDGLCEIASELIHSSLRDRLISVFTCWRERCLQQKRLCVSAEKRFVSVQLKKRLSTWRRKASTCALRFQNVDNIQNAQIVTRYWAVWRTRCAQKVALSRILKQEEWISNFELKFIAPFFANWQRVAFASARRRLTENEILVSSAKKLKCAVFDRWLSAHRKKSERLIVAEQGLKQLLLSRFFRQWRVSYVLATEVLLLQKSRMRQKFWEIWKIKKAYHASLRVRLENQIAIRCREVKRVVIRRWKDTARLHIIGNLSKSLIESRESKILLNCWAYWKRKHMRSKLFRFSSQRLLLASWKTWVSKMNDNTCNVLSTELYHKWLTTLAFQRWITMFQNRVHENGIAKLNGASLRDIPTERYPLYYVEPVDETTVSIRDPFVRRLLGIRVSGWFQSPSDSTASQQQQQQEQFGIMFVSQTQRPLQATFKEWKRCSEWTIRGELAADNFQEYAQSYRWFQTWRKSFLVRKSQEVAERCFLDRHNDALTKSALEHWLAVSRRFHTREARVYLIRRRNVLATAWKTWTKKTACLKASKIVTARKAISLSRNVIRNWKLSLEERMRERQAIEKAESHWKARTCSRFLALLKSSVMDRKTNIAIAAILFLKARRQVYFRKWKTRVTIIRMHTRDDRLAVSYHSDKAKRSAFSTWKNRCLQSAKFSLIEVRVDFDNRVRCQMKYLHAWKIQLNLRRKLSDYLSERTKQRLLITFTGWNARAKIARNIKLAEVADCERLESVYFHIWNSHCAHKQLEILAQDVDKRQCLKAALLLWKRNFVAQKHSSRTDAALAILVNVLTRHRQKTVFSELKALVLKNQKLSERLNWWQSTKAPSASSVSLNLLLSDKTVVLREYFSRWCMNAVMHQLADQHYAQQIVSRTMSNWMSKLNQSLAHQRTADEFHILQVTGMAWKRWVGKVELHQQVRNTLQMKRQILMAWHNWASVEKTIHQFVLQHKFKMWQKRALKKAQTNKLAKKADKMRRIHLIQTTFYRWWRITSLHLSVHQVPDSNMDANGIQHLLSSSQQFSTEWEPISKQIPLSVTIGPQASLHHVLTAEEISLMEEAADTFRERGSRKRVWMKWSTLHGKKNFERQRKLIFADSWAKKVLKRQCLNAWATVLQQ